ncbi:MFS general substrate transporter [Multifurca ochricompacta]|uniref:MFS general substrate transporter n=1 Tax=Multifurca ochricompacta TaxID=376703 RepID=A0AAD4QMF8_9AGAM|nr:MFS general substrate transporter [Multifurca ochricompacta]
MAPSAAPSPPAGTTKWKIRLQMMSLCWTMFLMGWNDGSLGPLLPRIQKVYHVNFFVVSLIFISNCLGIILSGLMNVYLSQRLGFGKVLVISLLFSMYLNLWVFKVISLGSALSVIVYCIQIPAPPFPVFILSYFINGFSMGLQGAHVNGYVTSLKRPASKLGIAHCAYGLGAFSAPLLATRVAQLPRWSFQYLASIGIALVNVSLLAFVFRFRKQDSETFVVSTPVQKQITAVHTLECMHEIGESMEERETDHENHYVQIMRHKTIHLIALFILFYVGVEVTIGGWIVSYVIDIRGGGPSAGYISSGFFGGLALGRVSLLWVNRKLGNRRAVLIYMFLAMIFELVVWTVPSLISGAVAISLIGLILGPIYPIAMDETGKVLPRWLCTGAIGWIGAFGTAGSALMPFTAGVLAQQKGIWTLQPLLLSMMALMVGLWVVVPRQDPRRED